MTSGEFTSGSGRYAQMPMEARHQLALTDPDAAREMALGEHITLATQVGYRALEDQAQRDLATVRDRQQAIGESYAGDADEMENTEQQYLKAEMPAYAAAYAESRRILDSAVVYHEELPGRISFGSKFAATIQYPDRDAPSTRRYVLAGPGEVSLWKGKYEDGGERFTVVSYLSPVGRALWGVDATEVAQQHPTLQLPNNADPAVVLQIDLLGTIDQP